MRFVIPCLAGLCLAAMIGLAAAGDSGNGKTAKLTNLQGRVRTIDTDSSIITVDTKSGTRRLVVYRPDTTLKYGHSSKGKDSSWDQVHESNYISCAGTYDEKMRLVAKSCVHRESR